MNDARAQLIDTMEQLQPHLMWALRDLTDDQRNYFQGTNNPIGYTAWHVARSLDNSFSTVVVGTEQIWDARGYREQLHFPEARRSSGLTHEETTEDIRVEPWSVFLQYVDEVLDSIVQYLKTAPDEELLGVVPESRIDASHPIGEYSRARVLRGRITHATLHSGEIFCLRGALGLQGAP